MSDFYDVFQGESNIPAAQTQQPETQEQQLQEPFDTEAYKQRKQEERQAVFGLADSAAIQLAGDENNLKEFLDITSRLDYSPTNSLLIQMQRPLASYLREGDSWKEDGFYIKKGEKAIKLLKQDGDYLVKETNTVKTSYKVYSVFDISQTNAVRNASPVTQRSEREIMAALISKTVPVELSDKIPDGLNAFYNREAILVRRGVDFNRLIQAIAIERCLAEIDRPTQPFNRNENIFAASCAAYIVCRKNHIEIDHIDISKFPSAFDKENPDLKRIKAELKLIRDTSRDVSREMYRALNPREKSKEDR